MNITIVIPIKNEVGSIKILYDEIVNVMSKIENISYEIFLVDDGSVQTKYSIKFNNLK